MTRWSTEEERYLKNNYKQERGEIIAEELGRTKSSIRHKAWRLGLKGFRTWTDEEINFLKENYKEKAVEEIAEELDRTPIAVSSRAWKEGVLKTNMWSKEEVDYLREHEGEKIKEIAKGLDNRSQKSVRYKIKRLNLSFDKQEKRRWWEEDETHKCRECGEIKPVRDFIKRQTICKECHKKINREKIERSGRFLNSLKEEGECAVCGKKYQPGVMDFHHVNKEEKEHAISDMRSYSLHLIKEELEKCVLVCANCHRKLECSYLEMDLEDKKFYFPEIHQ